MGTAWEGILGQKKKKKQLGKKIGEELYSGNGREKPSGKPSGLDGGWLSKE